MPVTMYSRDHRTQSTLDAVKAKLDAFERSVHDQKLALANAFTLPETVLLELTRIPSERFSTVPFDKKRSFIIDSFYSHYLIEECSRRIKRELDAHAEASDEPFTVEQKALLHKVEETRQEIQKRAADKLIPEIATLVIGKAAFAQTDEELAGEMPFVMFRLSQAHDILIERMPRSAIDLLLAFPGVSGRERAEALSLALKKWSKGDRILVQRDLQAGFSLRLLGNRRAHQNP